MPSRQRLYGTHTPISSDLVTTTTNTERQPYLLVTCKPPRPRRRHARISTVAECNTSTVLTWTITGNPSESLFVTPWREDVRTICILMLAATYRLYAGWLLVTLTATAAPPVIFRIIKEGWELSCDEVSNEHGQRFHTQLTVHDTRSVSAQSRCTPMATMTPRLRGASSTLNAGRSI